MKTYTFYNVGNSDILISDEKGIISFNTNESIDLLEKISKLEYRIIINGNDMMLESLGCKYGAIIENYKELLNREDFSNIKNNIKDCRDKYGIDFKLSSKVNKKPKRDNKYANAVVRKGLPIALAGILGLGVVSSNFSKKDNEKSNEIEIPVETVTNSALYASGVPYNSEVEIEIKHHATLDGEIESLLAYFNIGNRELLDKFINNIIETHKEYSYQDIMDILYEASNKPIEEKINYILQSTHLTRDQLNFVAACAIAEAWGDGTKYETVYAVASTMYNRISDKDFTDEVTRANKDVENAGFNPYYQVIHKNQFQVYSDERYKNYLGNYECVGYKAFIDMFYTGLTMHDYLYFLGNSYTPEGIKKDRKLDEMPVQFFDHDNIYFTRLINENRVQSISKTIS